MQARLERLEAVQDAILAISRISASGNDISGFLREVHQIIGRIMYAANFYVALYDAADNTIRFVYEVDEVDAPLDPEKRFTLQSPEESPTASVILNRKPLVMTAEQDSHKAWGYGTRSEHWIGYPLLDQFRNAFGAMVIQSYRADQLYTEEDQALFGLIAAHVSATLQSLRSVDQLEHLVRERTAALHQQIEEKQRAETLQRVLYQIAELSIVTSVGDRKFARLHQIIGQLIPVPNFMVALFEPATSEFRIAYFVDEIDGDQTGIRFPLGRGLTSYVVQSRQAQLFSRERLERMSASGEIEILGNLSAYSWMGAPLLADQHLFGVIIIQSYHPDLSYTDADLELLSFVASHVAAALARLQASEALGKSNRELTETLQALTTAQSELIHQEKLASLGRLVAGVAHEINTPLGIVVTATSHLAEEVQLTRRALQQGTLTQKMLEEFFDICDESLRILTTNSQRGAALVRSFKQVAVDQSHDAARHFDLKRYLDETLLALQPKLRLRQVKIALNCPENLQLHTYPGAVSQILTNLVMNSLTHGLENISEASIRIQVRLDQETVFLDYEDNGCGMSAENLQHLFEPFFTTRRGQGGSGLGAHIVYNLVTGLLGGQIKAYSEAGQGLRYEIRFPKTHKSLAGSGI